MHQITTIEINRIWLCIISAFLTKKTKPQRIYVDKIYFLQSIDVCLANYNNLI